jgi:hypothetical protein
VDAAARFLDAVHRAYDATEAVEPAGPDVVEAVAQELGAEAEELLS